MTGRAHCQCQVAFFSSLGDLLKTPYQFDQVLNNFVLGGESEDESENSTPAATVYESEESSDGGDLAVIQPTPAPVHLLLVSLLEHICSLYVQDTNKRNQVFKGTILAEYTILPEISSLMASHSDQHDRKNILVQVWSLKYLFEAQSQYTIIDFVDLILYFRCFFFFFFCFFFGGGGF